MNLILLSIYLEHSHNIRFDIENHLITINKQRNMYLNSEIEEFLIYNVVKHNNGFCNIYNLWTDFNYNIYKDMLDNNSK